MLNYANYLHYAILSPSMKLTKHRQEILDTLTCRSGAMTAAEVHAALPHINLVTIYRNLEAFAKVGSIKKLHFDGNEARFEYQTHPHHHAVCNDCDKVIHFSINEGALKRVLTIPNFDVSNIELVVHGACTHAHSTTPKLVP